MRIENIHIVKAVDSKNNVFYWDGVDFFGQYS